MYNEKNHEREQIRKELVRSIYKNAEEYYSLLEKLGIDPNNKEQMDKFIEGLRISSFLQIDWFFKRIRESKERKQILLDGIELIKAKTEFLNLVKSCNRFPKWLRIRIHRKKIKYIADRILEYQRKSSNPSIYSGSWEIKNTLNIFPMLKDVFDITKESLMNKDFGANKDGID